MADGGTADDPNAVTSTGESGGPSSGRPVDLAPDTIADSLQRDGKTHDLITLCGFLGTSDAAGYVRLFTDPTFQCWVDICEDDIRHRQRIPAEQDAFGGRSMVWVAREALLVKGEVTRADAEAKFLTGAWSSEAPSQLGDEGLDRATMTPKYARGVSPRPTGSHGCCT
jgi:hypothetical protein